MTFCVPIFQALRTGAPSTATWLHLKHFSSQGLDEVRVFDPPDFRTKSHFEWSALPRFGSTMSKNGYCRSGPEFSATGRRLPSSTCNRWPGDPRRKWIIHTVHTVMIKICDLHHISNSWYVPTAIYCSDLQPVLMVSVENHLNNFLSQTHEPWCFSRQQGVYDCRGCSFNSNPRGDMNHADPYCEIIIFPHGGSSQSLTTAAGQMRLPRWRDDKSTQSTGSSTQGQIWVPQWCRWSSFRLT